MHFLGEEMKLGRFKPQRGKFTRAGLKTAMAWLPGFKPQRGKFTLIVLADNFTQQECFKPQRGKFTQCKSL